MKKNLTAFSLIELSIVILIIGILIAGVMQTSRLVAQSKIKTAQTLTQSSSVAGIRNLLFWLDATNEDNFLSAETEDGSQLTQWKDSNPQSTSKYFAIKTASSQVTYKRDGINNIPTVSFDGTAGTTFFDVSATNSIANVTVISLSGNSYTFFAVSKLDPTVNGSDTVNRPVFYNGHSALNGFGYMRDGTGINLGKRAILHGGQTVADSATNITFDAEVISAFYTSGTFNFFINGVAEVVTPPTGGMAPPAVTGGVNFRIGGANSTEIWKGFISEIIIFDGALKTNDRKDIEKYLGRKYGIKVQ